MTKVRFTYELLEWVAKHGEPKNGVLSAWWVKGESLPGNIKTGGGVLPIYFTIDGITTYRMTQVGNDLVIQVQRPVTVMEWQTIQK